jgi:ATP-binding cassette subfamily B protein
VRLSHLTRASQESFSRVTATLAESVNGIRVTQGFVRQETNAGLFRSLLADHSRYNIALARTSAILTPLLELNSRENNLQPVNHQLQYLGWKIFLNFSLAHRLLFHLARIRVRLDMLNRDNCYG